MTLSAVLTALTGLELQSTRDRSASAPSPIATNPHAPRNGAGEDAGPQPAVVGAAVACERFDLSPADAASLADCEISAVRQVLAERGGADDAANDPPDDR